MARFVRQIVYKLSGILGLWLVNVVALATGQPNVLLIDSAFTFSNLKGYVWLAEKPNEVQEANQFWQQIKQGRNGHTLTDEVPNLGNGDEHQWIGFQVKNTGRNPKTLIVELDFIGPDDISFYAWDSTQRIKTVEHISWQTRPIERDVPHRVPAFRLTVRPGQVYTCALRIRQLVGYLVIPIQIQDEYYFDLYSTFVNVTHGLTAGFLLLAMVIGLAFWALTHQRLYGYYVIYAVGIAGFVLEEQGYLNQYLLGFSDMLASSEAWAVFSQIAVIGHTLFAIRFLQLDQLKQYRGWVTAGMIVCVMSGLLVLGLLIGLPFNDVMYNVSLLVSFTYILLSFFYLILAARQERRESYLYVLAVSPLFLSILYGVLATFGLLPESWLLFGLFSYTPIWEIGVLCVGLAISFSWEQRQKVQAIQESAHLQQEMVRALDEAQESERQRIAGDLHDDVGNTLAAAKGSLSTISRKLIIKTEFPEVAKAQSLIEKAGQDLRTISHNLMPVEFEKYKLSDVVSQAVERANASGTGTQFDFIQAGTERQLIPERSLIIYRIINELINNILKHSSAKTAIVQMVFQSNSLIVTVEDDGKGFQPGNSGIGSSGIGLKNVSSRSNYIGATLDVSSNPSGTCVIVEVPYD